MTAFTFTVTLSRVMHSWLGTSIVTVRRSIFTIRSMIGRMTNRPGPRAPTSRPSRKITPRSYSETIFTEKNQTMKPHGGISRMNEKIVSRMRISPASPPSSFARVSGGRCCGISLAIAVLLSRRALGARRHRPHCMRAIRRRARGGVPLPERLRAQPRRLRELRRAAVADEVHRQRVRREPECHTDLRVAEADRAAEARVPERRLARALRPALDAAVHVAQRPRHLDDDHLVRPLRLHRRHDPHPLRR